MNGIQGFHPENNHITLLPCSKAWLLDFLVTFILFVIALTIPSACCFYTYCNIIHWLSSRCFCWSLSRCFCPPSLRLLAVLSAIFLDVGHLLAVCIGCLHVILIGLLIFLLFLLVVLRFCQAFFSLLSKHFFPIFFLLAIFCCSSSFSFRSFILVIMAPGFQSLVNI